MSLYKDASLAMIPSAYKDGKLYSIRPTDGSGDFTFSRGSNLAATRVDVNGLIEKGRENLLLQSNSFNVSTWNKNAGGTFTSGQSGYDGTNDAWQFNVTTASNSGAWQNITFSGVATFSAYFKKGTLDKIGFTNYAGSGYECWFDLTNGTIGQQTGDLIDAKIVSVGGGWYRCSITDLASGNNYFQLKPSNSYSGTSIAGNIYIQDSQVELGLVATPYIETGASTAQAGILEDMPRLDYSGGASCPSLLLEPQRSNVMAQSEYFGGSYYVKGSGVSVVDNNYTSPEGLVNGAKLVGATGTDRNGSVIGRIVSVSSSTTYTASIYVYRDTATQCTLYLRDGSTGVILSKSVTLESGWQRIDKSLTTGASTSQMNLYLGNTDGDIGIYGFQVEVGSYPTSYIPTYGSSVTRSFDVCKKTNIDSLIAEEGTAFIDVTNGDENEVNAFMTIADSSVYPDHIWIGQNGTTLSLYVKANDSYSLIANNIVSIEGRKKIAVVYTNESIKVFVNGTNEYTTLNKTLPSQLNRVELNAFNTSINTGTARYDQAILFPTALTDSECIALTTI